MSSAHIAVRTTNTATTQASVELIASASARYRLLEIAIVSSQASGQTLGLGRPNAIGVTPVDLGPPSLFQRDDSTDPACTTKAALTWGTSPTAPTTYLRRWTSASVAGVGITWCFPRGIAVNASGTLVIFNVTTAAALDVYSTIDE